MAGLLGLLLVPLGTAAGVESPVPAGGRACFGEPATIVGTPGSDRIVGTPAADVIVSLGGDDHVLGGDGRDRICGGDDDDEVDGRYGADFVRGGAGDDRVKGGPRDDLLVGGSGRDGLAAGDGRSDTLVGGPGRDVLRGSEGNSSADYLFGGGGDDFLSGGEGGADNLYPGGGDDYVSGGGGGTDVASYEFSGEGVTIDLSDDTSQDGNATGEGSDFLVDVEGVIGSDESDTINGTEDGERIRARGGDDAVTAGDGFDEVDGGEGSDFLDGGADRDRVSFEDSDTGVIASLRDESSTGPGTDSLRSFEDVEGSYFDDELTGDERANSLYGSYGTNALFGLAGDDYLEFGDTGDAGPGNDECIWTTAEGCERNGHFDPPSLPFISHPLQAETRTDLDRISGGVAGGLGGPRDTTRVLVSLRRITPNGCWWWDAGTERFERGACLSPRHNETEVADEHWSIRVDASLPSGHYQASVVWPNFKWSCGGAFAPMCVEFEVS